MKSLQTCVKGAVAKAAPMGTNQLFFQLETESGQCERDRTLLHETDRTLFLHETKNWASSARSCIQSMHQETELEGPVNCPNCGKRLEPKTVALEDEEDDSELNDMSRRFWIGPALTTPLLGDRCVVNRYPTLVPAARHARSRMDRQRQETEPIPPQSELPNTVNHHRTVPEEMSYSSLYVFTIGARALQLQACRLCKFIRNSG